MDLKAEYKDRYTSDELKAVIAQFRDSIGSMTGSRVTAARLSHIHVISVSMTKGDCVKCFQTTKHNRRHCEECLEEMRYKRRVKSVRERCHPDNRWMFPEVFEE